MMPSAIERGLPANLDAERFVLGSILLDDSFLSQTEKLRPDDFTLEKHRRIFQRMRDVHARGEHIGWVAVAEELTKHQELESCDGRGYLVSLDDGIPQLPNIDSYVRIVKEKATLRRIIFASQNLQDRCMVGGEGPAEILAAAHSTFLEMAEPESDDVLDTPYDIISREIEAHGITAFLDGGDKGIQTPIPWLNRTIIGLQKGHLIIVAARTSLGKSSMVMQMAHYAAVQGSAVLMFPLEDSGLSISLELACRIAGVDSMLFRAGKMNPQERNAVMSALADTKHLPLYIDKKSRSAEDIHAKIRRAIARGVKIDMACVDYAQLVGTSERAENRNLAVGAVARKLLLSAQEFGIPIVLASQITRPAQKSSPNPPPTLEDLRDSGELENSARVVILIHGERGSGTRELIVAKQCNGPVGSTRVAFVEKHQVFTGLEPEHAEDI